MSSRRRRAVALLVAGLASVATACSDEHAVAPPSGDAGAGGEAVPPDCSSMDPALRPDNCPPPLPPPLKYIEIIGSCDPDGFQGYCDGTAWEWMPYSAYRCEEIEGEWRLLREDCVSRRLSCEGARCVEPRPIDEAESCRREGTCVLGGVYCGDTGRGRVRCGMVQGLDDPYPCAKFAERLPPCGANAICLDGLCVPTCATARCDCPDTQELACGADRRTYWNDCFRDCAGVEPGAGCTLDEWREVWRPERAVVEMVPGRDGTVGLFRNPLDEWEYSFTNRRELSIVRFRGEGERLVAEEVWAGGVSSSELPRWLRLPNGTVLVMALGQGHELLALTAERAESIVRLHGYPGPMYGFAYDALGALLHTPNGLFRVQGEPPYALRQEAGYSETIQPNPNLDVDEQPPFMTYESPMRSIDTLTLEDGAASLHVSVDWQTASLWRIDAARPRRNLLDKLTYPRGFANWVELWTAGGELQIAALTLELNTEVMGLNHRVYLDAWDGSCSDRIGALLWTASSISFTGKTTRHADIFGDGDPELVWSAGDMNFVLGRGPNGVPFLRAVLPTDPGPDEGGAQHLEVVPVDLDGDGADELFQAISATSGASRPFSPSGAAYKLVRRGSAPP